MRNYRRCRNESITSASPIKSIKPKISYIKGSQAICKIIVDCYEGIFKHRDLKIRGICSGTGFFIKFKDPEIPYQFKYFLMTCEHVIQKEIFEQDRFKFNIKYNFEKNSRTFLLDRKERFIKEYKSDYDLDITIVEMKQGEIPNILFLEPDYSLNEYNKKQLFGKKIIIHQYPLGLEQSESEGRIVKIYDKIINYTASTENGSSGSPILLEKQEGVIGIHFNGRRKFEDYNYGNFIFDVYKDVQNIEEVDYIYEEGLNYDSMNYTSLNNIDKKTQTSREYNHNNYKIFLKVLPEDYIHVKIENIKDNITYEKKTKFIFSKKLIKELKNYDKKIYQSDIEEFDDYVIIYFNDENKTELIAYRSGKDDFEKLINQISSMEIINNLKPIFVPISDEVNKLQKHFFEKSNSNNKTTNENEHFQSIPKKNMLRKPLKNENMYEDFFMTQKQENFRPNQNKFYPKNEEEKVESINTTRTYTKRNDDFCLIF